MRTFYRLVANTLVASVTNNFLWFALTFWVYLETRSVIASSVIGGGFMLIFAASGLFFGTLIDRNRRRTSMLISNGASLAFYLVALAVFLMAPEGAIPSLRSPLTWIFIATVLAGAVAGNLRAIALNTTVTLLVPGDRHDRANGLVGTANGIAFAVTSVFSGLAIGQLGMLACVWITIGLTLLTGTDLLLLKIPGDEAPRQNDGEPSAGGFDLRGAMAAVRRVDGLFALLLFSTFNNFLGGVFMALMDPYGLELMSVEAWGILLAITSSGFIIGGILVARRGLGRDPARAILFVNLAMWSITILFPLVSSVATLAIGFFFYMILIPRAEAAEQTVIQRVVPYVEQGRVFGFAQSLETAASPVTAFLIGPIAQAFVIPFMSEGGSGADAIGTWFGTGPERGMALIFILAGTIGVIATFFALNSTAFRRLCESYRDAAPQVESGAEVPAVGP